MTRQCLILRTHRQDEEDEKLLGKMAEDVKAHPGISVAVHLNLPNDEEEVHVKTKEHWQKVCVELGVLFTCSYEVDYKKLFPWYRGAWYHSYCTFISAWRTLDSLLLPKEAGKKTNAQYWFVEYDARFVGSWFDLLEFNKDKAHDLLGTHVEAFTPSNWGWEAWRIPGENWEIPLVQRWKFFAAVMRVSHRLCAALEAKMDKYYGTLETFVPSICVQSFGSASLVNFDASLWNGETVRYCPPHCTAAEFRLFSSINKFPNWQNKLLHPVKTQSTQPASLLERQRQETQQMLDLSDKDSVTYYRQHVKDVLNELLLAAVAQHTGPGHEATHLQFLLQLSDEELLIYQRKKLRTRLQQLACCISNPT